MNKLNFNMSCAISPLTFFWNSNKLLFDEDENLL